MAKARKHAAESFRQMVNARYRQHEPESGEDLTDYIHCPACGQPFNDGGGLYCSARCEEIGNPGADSFY